MKEMSIQFEYVKREVCLNKEIAKTVCIVIFSNLFWCTLRYVIKVILCGCPGVYKKCKTDCLKTP